MKLAVTDGQEVRHAIQKGSWPRGSYGRVPFTDSQDAGRPNAVQTTPVVENTATLSVCFVELAKLDRVAEKKALQTSLTNMLCRNSKFKIDK